MTPKIIIPRAALSKWTADFMSRNANTLIKRLPKWLVRKWRRHQRRKA